jgi:hypothetical protein
MRKSNVAPYEVRRRLDSWQKVASAISRGLAGDPFTWTGGELENYRPKAKAMGATLVTKTKLKRDGYRLKKGAQPVGSGYFFAPISRDAALYVLECQAVREDK